MSERFESSGCLHSTANFLDNPSSLVVLGMNGLRQQQQSDQSHVAQQSRRDKLRVPHTSSPHQLQDFAGHLVQLPNKYSALSNNHSDVFRVSSFRDCSSSDLLSHHHHQHDPIPTTNTSSIFPSHNQHSEIHHNPSMLLADEQKDVIMNQEPNCVQPSSVIRAISIDHQDSPSFASSSSSYRVVPSDFMPPSSSSKVLNDQQTLSYWKGQQSCDWISNFVNGSSSNNINTNSRSMKEVDFSAAPLYMKHGCNGYQDVQSSFTTSNQVPEISNQDCQKPYGEMNFNNSPLNVYQTSLQDVVTTSSNMGFEMVPLVEQKLRETGNGSSWVDGGNELVLLPSYVNQSSVSQVNEASTTWTNRPVDHGSSSSGHHWNGELGFAADKRGGNFVGGDPTTQSLSLSLSSHRPPSELHAPPYGDRFGSDLNMQYKLGTCSGSQDTRSNNPGYLFSDQLSPTRFKAGNSVENIAGSSAYARRCSGPLGPFTGYATILKNSKFLKPAQQLLDEFCGVTGSKLVATERTDKGFREVSSLSDLVNDESEIGRRDGNSGVSSSICSSKSVGEGRVGSGHCQSYQPEFQQKKAKLLYMLEEVCRRYKQYHQQMQMVVSSFESVAGLDAATPYTSLALKTISKHFRCLKNTIADQLRLIRKALGEDFSSPTSRVSSNKGDATVPRLRFIDQNPGKQAALGNRLGFLETQHHIWRPQRGLPERSVAVLRAWLFEHFLHPYPTDTDKHMLATQTGLTRSQVSNWFINARVRVWKPMVEEMHMLETKASSDVDLSPGRQSSIKPSMVDCSGQRMREYQCNEELMVNPISGRGQEYLNIVSSNAEAGQSSEQQWHQEKRSRMECQIPSSGMDGGYMGFIPYHQSALELGGLGSVSLTLGLRRSAESGQQQQQHEDHLRRHFGGQMVHDFVG